MTVTKPKKLLNPRLNLNFKAIFTQNTPESRCALKSFLSAAIGRKVVDVTVVGNEVAEQYEQERTIRYDINCEFSDGTKAEIEMQGSSHKTGYGKRVEYYVSRLLSTVADVGDDWENLPQVYQISVLDFKYDNSNENPIHHYSLTDPSDDSHLSGLLNVIFMELPKMPEITNLDDVKTLPSAVKWCKFLQEADNPDRQDLISKLAESEEGIMGAEATLSKISMDSWRWFFQNREKEIRCDYTTMIHGAMREGRAAGMAEGRAEGRVEGKAEGARETAIENAKNLLKLGKLSCEEIAECCLLPLEEVQKFAEELTK